MHVDKQSDDLYVIALGERFDFGCLEEFRTCYESIKPEGECEISIDFSSTKFIDSSALGMLINTKSFFGEDGVTIVLANCNEQIKKIFSISRFDKKFKIS